MANRPFITKILRDCPLRSDHQCPYGKCQWWDVDADDCSITRSFMQIAWSFSELADAAESIKALCKRLNDYIEFRQEREEEK